MAQMEKMSIPFILPFFHRKWFSVGYMAPGNKEYIYQAEPMTKSYWDLGGTQLSETVLRDTRTTLPTFLSYPLLLIP